MSTPPSPRATLMLARIAQAYAMRQGRSFVSPQDIRDMSSYVLTHRMVLSGSINAKAYVRDVLNNIPSPE